MRRRMPRLRRMLVPPAIAVGLVSSLGATQCAADPPGTSSGSTAKKATGTVVRCDGTRSCEVIFRRATTKRYLDRLRDKAPPTVLATATTEAACLLVTHTITGHVVCAVGTKLVTKRLTATLRRAAASKECLTVRIQRPNGAGTWRPISYDTTGGRDCAA